MISKATHERSDESQSAGQPAITIEGVGKRFGHVEALVDVDLKIAEGEFTSWLGSSGCGKTTLLRILGGLEEPTSGRISIGGITPSEIRRRKEIGIAFQRPALVPSRTALGNVELTLEVCRRREGFAPEQLLRDFGLGAFMSHYPHELSGGMQQRVNIACAIVHHPKLLLLDEPFGALDELTRIDMCEWLAKVVRRFRQTSVLVTHSVEEAVMLSDRVVVFSPMPGRVTEIVQVELEWPRPPLASEKYLREVTRVRAILHRAIRRGEGEP